MMFTHKRKTIEDYFDNTHSKKTRTHVQNMTNDEKKIKDAKNRDKYSFLLNQAIQKIKCLFTSIE